MAQILPLLKKPGLDEESPASYRPISNLNTLSKILEKLFAARLKEHVRLSSNTNVFQSAYRQFHSTETALLRILNDFYTSIDGKKITILVSLDLSAAFDTLDHSTMLHRLEHTFGVSGPALLWISTYLAHRTHYVRVDDASSDVLNCNIGCSTRISPGSASFCALRGSCVISPRITSVVPPSIRRWHTTLHRLRFRRSDQFAPSCQYVYVWSQRVVPPKWIMPQSRQVGGRIPRYELPIEEMQVHNIPPGRRQINFSFPRCQESGRGDWRRIVFWYSRWQALPIRAIPHTCLETHQTFTLIGCCQDYCLLHRWV